MRSNTDERDRPTQPQLQQTVVRSHASLRRTHSPLYDYTASWANDLFPPARNPIDAHDRMVAARRRWTRSVCVGFVVCLVANVASTVYVCVTLDTDHDDDDDNDDDALIRQFMSQARPCYESAENCHENANIFSTKAQM